MDSIRSISFPNEPLISWTFLDHFCYHVWVGFLLLCCCTHPKVMAKMSKKCSTDQRFIRKRNTSYKIETLEGMTKIEVALEFYQPLFYSKNCTKLCTYSAFQFQFWPPNPGNIRGSSRFRFLIIWVPVDTEAIPWVNGLVELIFGDGLDSVINMVVFLGIISSYQSRFVANS